MKTKFSAFTRLLFFSFVFTSFTNSLFSQRPTTNLVKVKSDKCHELYTIPPIAYETHETIHPVYIGEEYQEMPSFLDSIIVNEEERNLPARRWKQMDSTNGPETLMWKLVDTPFIPEYLVIVNDTTQTKDYIYETFVVTKIIEEKRSTRWVEVMCKEKLSTNQIEEIQTALAEEDFYSGAINGWLDEETLAALIEFQKENELLIGHLDFDSLEALGVDY